MHVKGFTDPIEAAEWILQRARPSGTAKPETPEAAEVRARREANQKANVERRAKEREGEELSKRKQDREFIDATLARCVPIPGTHADAYLMARRIALQERHAVDLYYCLAVDYWGQASPDATGATKLATPPAMVAKIRNVVGDVVGLHLTYLDPNEPRQWAYPPEAHLPKEQRINQPKKMRGAHKGGLIRLGEITDKLTEGEGIESTLSAVTLFPRDDMSYAVAINLGNMAGRSTGTLAHPTKIGKDGKPSRIPNGIPDPSEPGVIHPAIVVSRTLLMDADSEPFATAGAMVTAVRRSRSRGSAVFVATPPPGMDFNDALMSGEPVAEPETGEAFEARWPIFAPPAAAEPVDVGTVASNVLYLDDNLKMGMRPWLVPGTGQWLVPEMGPGRAEGQAPEAMPGEPSRPTTKQSPPPHLDVFDVGDETGDIPPREWLLGRTFCRAFVSGIVASGGVGKTTIRILQALALASGRELTGEHVFVRCRVMVVSLEDDFTELRRRVRAAMLHHKIGPADVEGYLLLTTPRGLKIARYGDGGVVRGDLFPALVAEIDLRKIDLVCIDPTIKAHGLKENENSDIDQFVDFLAQLAAQKNIAIDLTSHERKGSKEPGDAERQRGSSSQKDAARLVYTLTGMSKEDAGPLGVGEVERRSLVRIDSAKVNIAPPSTKATWFKLVGVPLGNGTELYPAGDTVQTVEGWTPAPLFEGLSESDINAILRRIGAGMADGRRYSVAPVAKDRAAWRAVQAERPTITEKRARAMVATWVKSQVFEVGEYDDPTRRETATGILSARLIGPIADDE